MINASHVLSPAMAPLFSAPPVASPSSGTGVDSTTLLPIAGVLVVLLALFVGAVVVGLFLIMVVANRTDPGADGRRPQSVYFFTVSFLTLVTTITGSMVVVFSLVQLIATHSPGMGDATARAVVLGGLITVLSGALMRMHLRRGVALADSGDTSEAGPLRRVAQSYVSGVAYVCVLILLVAAVLAAYLVFALAGPGVFGSFGGRADALRDLIDAVYLGAVALVVLRSHRNLLTPGLDYFAGSGRGGAERFSGLGTLGGRERDGRRGRGHRLWPQETPGSRREWRSDPGVVRPPAR